VQYKVPERQGTAVGPNVFTGERERETCQQYRGKGDWCPVPKKGGNANDAKSYRGRGEKMRIPSKVHRGRVAPGEKMSEQRGN